MEIVLANSFASTMALVGSLIIPVVLTIAIIRAFSHLAAIHAERERRIALLAVNQPVDYPPEHGGRFDLRGLLGRFPRGPPLRFLFD